MTTDPLWFEIEELLYELEDLPNRAPIPHEQAVERLFVVRELLKIVVADVEPPKKKLAEMAEVILQSFRKIGL